MWFIYIRVFFVFFYLFINIIITYRVLHTLFIIPTISYFIYVVKKKTIFTNRKIIKKMKTCREY